jgi:hypothetical protein
VCLALPPAARPRLPLVPLRQHLVVACLALPLAARPRLPLANVRSPMLSSSFEHTLRQVTWTACVRS